jgi:hypothetical protein
MSNIRKTYKKSGLDTLIDKSIKRMKAASPNTITTIVVSSELQKLQINAALKNRGVDLSRFHIWKKKPRKGIG